MLPEDRGAAVEPRPHEEGWKRKWFVGEHDELGLGPIYDLVGPLRVLYLCVSAPSFSCSPFCFSLPFKFKSLLKNGNNNLVFFDLPSQTKQNALHIEDT